MMKEITDLIGKTGTLTRTITVTGAVETPEGEVEVCVKDDFGNEFWVPKDANVSLF
ncbi:hypothetical protein [Paenibacillus sp. S150]|uniref:hypothetical protein n=1 Tax=Paenibacillus sp. S150 TaxID=2749826 RepID=UPI001C5608F9|nr:hypothetical protein [Paenibacillus sp. S150]MBW4083577.1 hypothetical protein [Paenibacillus sp. S150]